MESRWEIPHTDIKLKRKLNTEVTEIGSYALQNVSFSRN